MKLYLRERCNAKGCNFHEKHLKVPKSKKKFCPACLNADRGMAKTTYMMKKWHVDASKKNSKGKWITVPLALYESYQESNEKAIDRIKEYQDKEVTPVNAPKGEVTVAEVADSWLRTRLSFMKDDTLAESTYNTEKGLVENHVKPNWGDELVADFFDRCFPEVVAYKEAMRDFDPDKPPKEDSDKALIKRYQIVRKYSPRHINSIIATLSAVMSHAIFLKKTTMNPLKGFRYLGIPEYREFVLKRTPKEGETESEICRLMRVCYEEIAIAENATPRKGFSPKEATHKARTLYAMVIICLNSGMRKETICTLRKDEIFWEEGVIRKIVKHHRKKKVKTLAVIPLTPQLTEILKWYMEYINKTFTFPIHSKQHEYVFPSTRYRKGRGPNMDKVAIPHVNKDTDWGWQKVKIKANLYCTSEAEDAGLETVSEFHFHDLRHTYATYFLLDVGRGNIAALAKILGHTCKDVTERYAHVLNEEVIDAALKFKGFESPVLTLSTKLA